MASGKTRGRTGQNGERPPNERNAHAREGSKTMDERTHVSGILSSSNYKKKLRHQRFGPSHTSRCEQATRRILLASSANLCTALRYS